MLRVIQINLHHSKAASAALLLKLTKSGEDLVLIQEPWINGNQICGLGLKGYKIWFSSKSGKSRSCILGKSNLNMFLIPQYSDGDITAAGLEFEGNKVWLVSAYLAQDKTIPPDNLGDLIAAAQQKKIGVVLGCDANAHHTIWGSTDINERGELFFEYLLKTNLMVCNIGQEPTFITKNRQEVLDVTFASDHIVWVVREWRVAREHSFSDHRYITFTLHINPAKCKSFRNYRKTNWVKYGELLGRNLPVRRPIAPKTVEELDSIVETLTSACNISLEGSCPLVNVRGKQKPIWWSRELGTYRNACRKAFNKAKSTRQALDWSSYKGLLAAYKRELKRAKRKSWRLFCEKMEGVSETSRLRKILSTNPTSPNYLIKPDGSWTESCEESLKLLMETHFPGNIEVSRESDGNGVAHRIITEDIVNEKRILWAIRGFKPYKSAGLDRIVPAELQNQSKVIIPWLEVIFKGCLEIVHIPKSWTEVKVIFIPKAGKSSHGYPKDLRPITLSSFLLKTLERLIDVYIRTSINPSMWAKSQHAYCKGKSVETALHTLVRMIEKSLYSQEYSMVAFLDIEGAFNNVRTEAIMEGLVRLEVDDRVGNLINQMLISRIVNSELGESTIRRQVVRGTPQGGVLSPLLWNIAINGLLVELEKEGIGVIAYADDVAIAVSGKFLNTIKEVMQKALSVISKWASSCGLGINPAKTELVLFTKKYKIPEVTPPSLNDTRLVFAVNLGQ